MTSEGLTYSDQQAMRTQTGTAARRGVWALVCNRDAVIIGALMLVGLALRLWFLSVNTLDPRFSTADDGDYYYRALRFAVTGQYIDDFWLIRPPLHVFLFALLLRISMALGDLTMGLSLIRGVQVGLILLTIPVGYDLAQRLFNRRAGLIFAALLAVWYPLVELPAHTFSEPLFFFLFMLHLWTLIRWRDQRHWPWLAGSGATLGLGALTRAPALYATAFVVGWLLLQALEDGQQTTDDGRWTIRGVWSTIRGQWSVVLRHVLIVLLAFVVVVAPWTARNYLVYERFIPIDTLGPANLWLDLQPNRRENIELLKTIPQADRQAFAVEELRHLLGDDPLRLWQNAWPNFQHIWKAQFIEDFLLKSNFYTRPLRATWPLGIIGDVLWFAFTIGGLVGLALPFRAGQFRWLLLSWLGYTVLTVLLLHVEPRYLMPIWLVLMLHAAWVLSDVRGMRALLRQNRLSAILATLLVASFLVIFATYRNYPEAIARGVPREWHHFVGARAYAAGDYATAAQAFQRAVEVDPRSIDGRVDLARALMAQGRYDAALEVLGSSAANRAVVLRAAIARDQGDDEQAAALFHDAARWEGEDVQALTFAWLQPPATARLILGTDLDYGYITGFSFGETARLPSETISYRWLQGHGRIRLPLPRPLEPASFVELRMAGGQAAGTPLRVTFADGSSETLHVAGGQWRTYGLALPPTLAGQMQLDLALDAPTFIPARLEPASADLRPLSLMISEVRVGH